MTDPHQRWEDNRYLVLRTVILVISVGVSTVALVLLVERLQHIIGLMVISAFFATILNPMVDALTRLRIRRGLATSIVFFTGLAAFAGLAYTFVRPVVDAGQKFADDIPGFVDRAKNGEGRVGELIKQYNLDKFVEENAPKMKEALKNAGGPAVTTARKVASGVFALVTIMVLTFLMLLEAPEIIRGFLALLPPARAAQMQRIGRDAAKAITGYMFGNLVISVIAGTTAYIFLRMAHVPFANVLALWVGFADLLPLIGATVGAVPAVFIAFLHSNNSGIAALVFFIVYQQFENHVLQPVVMSRTVNLNPLLVLLSVLVGVELAGLAGALLAIPAAGVIQVVVRDIWRERMAKQRAAVAAAGIDAVPEETTP